MNLAEEQRRRQEVKDAYSGSTTWAERVDKMSPKQLTAIYLKLKSEGRVK